MFPRSFSLLCVVMSVGGLAQGEVVIQAVPVGNPGNPNNYDGFGGVNYTYNIGKHEVTNAQYCEFLNAVAAVGDPNGVYNTAMGGGWNDIGGISRSGLGTEAQPWVYSLRPTRGQRPVNYVSWYDALRFANWLHHDQPGLGSLSRDIKFVRN